MLDDDSSDRTIPPHGEAWAIEGPSGPIPIVTFGQTHGPISSVGYRFADQIRSDD